MQREDIAKMQERIHKIIRASKVWNRVVDDWSYTLLKLGLDYAIVLLIADQLYKMNHLVEAEQQIHGMFIKQTIGAETVREVLDKELAGRAKLIYDQVSPYIPKDAIQIVDYGCGDGQVAELLHQGLGKSVYGYDVRDYRAPGVTVPIQMIEGKGICSSNDYFSAGVMTNVLHHAEDNQAIINDVTRIIAKGRPLVVIETVPLKDEPIEFEVTFMNDYLYNRLFHSADIPVPGTYETTPNWINRFAKAGWKVEYVKDLGFDQPMIRDWHVLMVFTKL